MMNLDFVLETVNRKLIENQHPPLNFVEERILRGIWEYETYNEIAEESRYSSGYLTNVAAPDLRKRLSLLLNQRVTKKNCRALLEAYITAQDRLEEKLPQQSAAQFSLHTSLDNLPCYPNGAVSLDSPFYIARSPIEDQIYAEIKKPGSLVRIKAPQEMGKTSLLLRGLDYAQGQEYRTVYLNLQQIDRAILSDLNRFLRWLSTNVSLELNLAPRLDDYWDEDMGSKVSCSLYFRGYLLESIDSPVVLVLDEVNEIFEHPNVAKDFLPLLRSWYEEAKRSKIWQKLRLIVAHSTEIYVPLQLSQSPFNVGLPIQLTNFSVTEVMELAQRYKINWKTETEAQQLMSLVGGHPALVHQAIYYLSSGEITLDQLLKTAHTSTGIYSHHLQRLQATLAEQPELAIALQTVINAQEPVQLESIPAYKLSSMGLIRLKGNKATINCQLYRLYFDSYLKNN